MKNYNLPAQTRIGHGHLKVANLERSIDFYCNLLGFTLKQRYGEEAAFVAAGDYHHHIGLNVWFSKNGPQPARNAVGLFHLAIVLPERRDLALFYQRLRDADYPLTGASDHGVSEALYLNDPDGNGLEFYWDRAPEDWPKNDKGEIAMYTRPLDLDELLSLI